MGQGQPETLTRRERQVLDLLAEGRTNKQISDSLFIDVRTAEFHVANVLGKLGLESRAQVAAYVSRDERPRGSLAASNLPESLTSFVGRQSELSTLTTLLERSRLVTVTGAGGIGKTRLALQAARAWGQPGTDGPWFIDLAPLSNPDLLVTVILSTLGLPEERGRPAEETLLLSLRQRKHFLVVDNCEHLLAQVSPLVHRVLTSCPGVRVLATSRSSIGVDGEVLFVLAGLQLASEAWPEMASNSDAVRLFLDRTQLVRPGYEPGFDDLAEIGALCRVLEGMPLGIELAAGRMSGLTPREIRTRLEHGISLLTKPGGAAPDRHKTLEAAIGWSYSLLGEPAQAVFRRLSVFAGFDVEAAEAVCGGSPVDRNEVAGTLLDLVDSSLVVARSGGRATRYRLLEPIRQYAFARLKSNEKADALRKHAEYFRQIADREKPIRGTPRPTELATIETEQDNLRGALVWAANHDVSAEVQLLYGLERFWLLRGQLAELTAAIEHALAATKDGTFYRLRMLIMTSHHLLYGGNVREAIRVATEGLALAQQLDLRRDEQIAWNVLGNAQSTAHLPDAVASYERAIALARELGDGHRLAKSLANLGIEMIRYQNWERASALLDEALLHFREVGDVLGDQLIHMWQGMLAFAEGDDVRAISRWFSVLEDCLELPDWESIHRVLDGFAQLSIKTGDYESGLRLAGAAERIRLAVGVVEESDHPELANWLARARETLPREAADAAWTDGMRMTESEAIRYALEWAKSPLTRHCQQAD